MPGKALIKLTKAAKKVKKSSLLGRVGGRVRKATSGIGRKGRQRYKQLRRSEPPGRRKKKTIKLNPDGTRRSTPKRISRTTARKIVKRERRTQALKYGAFGGAVGLGAYAGHKKRARGR